VLRRLQDQKLIRVEGRDVELLDREALHDLARNILHE